MEVWKVLGIEPTTDKRKIKKAYAHRGREVHPEEKPDDFRILHAAYQEALKYAEVSGTMQPDAKKEEDAEQSDVFEGTEEELYSFFRENAREQEEKIAFFIKKWKEIRYEHQKPEVKEWWENYLKSEDFHEIQWNPEFVGFLAADMEKQLAHEYEIRLLFWEAYGFGEDASICRGNAQKLRMALYPAYERQCRQQERERLEAERQLVNKKSWKFMAYMLLGVFGIWFFYAALVHVNELLAKQNRREALSREAYSEEDTSEEYDPQEGDAAETDSGENDEEAISEPELVRAYLEERYPGTEFSEPVLEEEGVFSESVYKMHSLSHPDITFEAVIEYDIMDSTVCGMSEKYGQLLTEHYAKEYELEFFRLPRGSEEWPDPAAECDEIIVLCYQDTETLDEFCDTVIRMFREQAELQNLDVVGICKADACYRDIMVCGGTSGRYPGSGQFYRPWELEADQMQEMIGEGYEKYMVYFEPWNLSLEQCLEWRSACEENEEVSLGDAASVFSVSLSQRGGDILEIYIPVYICDVFGRVTNEKSGSKMILSGDAYYYLLSEGVLVGTEQDVTGFLAEKDGFFHYLGFRSKEKLESIEEFIPR